MTKDNSKKVSRRSFVVGSAAAAATTAFALDGCSQTSATEKLLESVGEKFPDAQLEYLDVDPSQVLPHTGMNAVDSLELLSVVKSFDLPLGSLVHQSSGSHALIMAPGASSKALIRLGFAELDSGSFTAVLDQALGANEDYVVYDARASDQAIVWVECNMIHGMWRVYATAFEGGIASEDSMQNAQLLDEGGDSWSPPQLAVVANKVYWTVMPDPNGPESTNDSYLKAAEFKSSGLGITSQTVYTSPGRMITNPTVSGDLLTFVPRVDADTVYYQLTTLDTKSNAIRNIAILPPSLRVANAVWLNAGFAFGIEANYNYARGLSLFGTYQQLGDGQYLYVNKAPVSAAAQIKELSFIKSTKNVLALVPVQGSVAIIDTPRDCVSYGDILAGTGIQDRLVLYTTVISRVGKGSGQCRVTVLEAY